jgi:heme A synthase
MALLIAVLMAFNTMRAFLDPVGFAAYLGLPLADPRDVGFVHVYGLRAAFVGLLTAGLIVRRDWRTLALVALAGLVMPLGDAALTLAANAEPATVARHVAIAVYLLATALLLQRAAARQE